MSRDWPLAAGLAGNYRGAAVSVQSWGEPALRRRPVVLDWPQQCHQEPRCGPILLPGGGGGDSVAVWVCDHVSAPIALL